MKKNDLIKTEDGIYRILSIEANRVLAIDCISKTMPKFYPVSSFGNGEFIDCMPADFPDMEDLSPADRKIAQERYTMIASAVSVVDDTQQRNLMIEKSSKQFGMSKQSIRSFLCSYLVYQDVAVLAPKQSKEKELTEDQKNMRWALNKFFYVDKTHSQVKYSYAEKAVSHIDGTAHFLSLIRFKSTVCELVYSSANK